MTKKQRRNKANRGNKEGKEKKKKEGIKVRGKKLSKKENRKKIKITLNWDKR